MEQAAIQTTKKMKTTQQMMSVHDLEKNKSVVNFLVDVGEMNEINIFFSPPSAFYPTSCIYLLFLFNFILLY